MSRMLPSRPPRRSGRGDRRAGRLRGGSPARAASSPAARSRTRRRTAPHRTRRRSAAPAARLARGARRCPSIGPGPACQPIGRSRRRAGRTRGRPRTSARSRTGRQARSRPAGRSRATVPRTSGATSPDRARRRRSRHPCRSRPEPPLGVHRATSGEPAPRPSWPAFASEPECDPAGRSVAEGTPASGR